MSKRWLVTGGAGQLGAALHDRLQGRPGCTVTALAHGDLDVGDAAALARVIDRERPDVVLNAAAFTNVDGCETRRDHAQRINGEAPGVLARLCRERRLRLVHVSTDYVFDGSADTPYAEDAATAPLSVYGETKLHGEQAVLDADPDALVVRGAWIYGRGRNFVAAVCRRALEAGSLRVVDDQIGSPTWAPDLADGLLRLLEADARGLYHLANTGVASRWDLARAALDHAARTRPELADLPIERIRTEDYPTPATRPLYTVLDCGKARRAGVVLRPWQEALAAYLDSEDSPLREAADRNTDDGQGPAKETRG